MIKVLSLAGTARSIGRQHGEQVVDLRPYIQASMQARLAVLRQQGVNLFPYLEFGCGLSILLFSKFLLFSQVLPETTYYVSIIV